MRQECTIANWHPTTNPNGGHGHWATAHRLRINDRDTVCGAVCFAKWQPVVGRARLTVELVYPRNRLPDRDNAYARCKGLIDAIRPHEHVERRLRVTVPCAGFVKDDSGEWLDPVVVPVYEKGVKATRLILESLS